MSEIFFVVPKKLRTEACEPSPQSVGDLAKYCEADVDDVIMRLSNICRQTEGIGVTGDQLLEKLDRSSADLGILNLTQDPRWGYRVDNCDLRNLLEALSQKKQVICVCDDGATSYSGALFLKSHGVANSFYLKAGLAALSDYELKKIDKLLSFDDSPTNSLDNI